MTAPPTPGHTSVREKRPSRQMERVTGPRRILKLMCCIFKLYLQILKLIIPYTVMSHVVFKLFDFKKNKQSGRII